MKNKNSVDRYGEWAPFRENSVKLADGSEMSASSILSCIASQAPMKENVDRFWQMIWEKNMTQVVMLTELQEDDEELCYPYWPEGQPLTFENGMRVAFKDEVRLLEEMKEYIQIRTFTLTHHGEEREITHYWYRNWEDFKTPSQSVTITTLIDKVRRDRQLRQSDAPLLVHCAAGIGRSGVFMTLYHMSEHEKKAASLFDFVGYLRASRTWMVGHEEQYEFCYEALSN